MQALAGLGVGEIILIFALLLILLGAKKFPELAKGLGQGLFGFRKAIEDESTEAGRALGGIYGKPAAEAITPENQVAELYNPAALRDKPTRQSNSHLTNLFAKLWQRVRRILRYKVSTLLRSLLR